MTIRHALYEFCIYTIAHPEKLSKAIKKRRPTKFTEAKHWKTAEELRIKAAAAGLEMPIMFGDATDCSRLIYWGLLEKTKIEGRRTHYFVKEVRQVKGCHSPQELVLRSSGKHIAPNFRRPYAICTKAAFLR